MKPLPVTFRARRKWILKQKTRNPTPSQLLSPNASRIGIYSSDRSTAMGIISQVLSVERQRDCRIELQTPGLTHKLVRRPWYWDALEVVIDRSCAGVFDIAPCNVSTL